MRILLMAMLLLAGTVPAAAKRIKPLSGAAFAYDHRSGCQFWRSPYHQPGYPDQITPWQKFGDKIDPVRRSFRLRQGLGC